MRKFYIFHKFFFYILQESKYAVLPRHISLILKKKDATEEHFWPRLLKEKTKVSV